MRGWIVVLVALLPTVGAFASLPEDAPTPLLVGPVSAPASDAAWARALTSTLPQATSVNDDNGNKVWDDLERRFLASPTLRAIVTFTAATPTDAGLDAARRVVPALDPTHVFHIVPGFAAELSLHEALAIAALPEVRQIEYDHPAVAELETATALFGADTVVDAADITGDRDGDLTNYTADDVVVAILDTGFAGEHKDLDGGKILHFHDMATEPQDAPYDPDGHGSHVAGIVAGTGDADPRYRGVAPGAAIVGIKITGSTDTMAATIEAYEWIVANKERFGIDITTISFGFGASTDGTSALELAVDKVWEAGIVCFKSTGNSGPGRTTVTIPGGARGIIATGSMLDAAPGGAPPGGLAPLASAAGDSGFLLSSYSSRGPTTDGRIKPDIVAPGQSITSVDAATTDGYATFSGTSMASPFAAGAAALVLDANPHLAPDEVRDVLFRSAEDWGLRGPDIDYGHGRLRVDRAVELALHLAGANGTFSVPVHPMHEVRSGTLAAPYSETTIEVNDTTLPFAVTAIVEGVLVQLVVLDPEGTPIASLDTPDSRQHQLGFSASQTGTYTLRLVGQPGAGWVVDVSHGVVPQAVSIPSFSGLLEAAPPALQAEESPAAPVLLVLAAMAGLVILAMHGTRRR